MARDCVEVLEYQPSELFDEFNGLLVAQRLRIGDIGEPLKVVSVLGFSMCSWLTEAAGFAWCDKAKVPEEGK